MIKILYLSNDNRCRSVVAEAITRHIMGGLLIVDSAGENPDKSVHPAVFRYLRDRDVETLELNTKQVDELGRTDYDLIVLLSDGFNRDDLTGHFPDAKITEFYLQDVSHGDISSKALYQYLDEATSAIEYRLRRAMAESTATATDEGGKEIIDPASFIDTFCLIEDEKVAKQ